MTYADEIYRCSDCSRTFTLTASVQRFCAENGFSTKPGRCAACRTAFDSSRGAKRSRDGRSLRDMYVVNCNQCGLAAQVAFQPRTDKPVYCPKCFESRQAEAV
jgi:CxxC-x17-CxxC domain-containing protein